MKLTRSTAVAHPEGWATFKIIDSEEATGKFGTQIKWKMQSSERDEEGGPILLTYYTGTVLSQSEKCKLTNLFIACGVVDTADEIDDSEWDSDILIGKSFEGRVDEQTSEKGTFFNIGAVRRAKKKGKKVEVDPFEDE